MARTIALLCHLGDVTISWDASNDAAVLVAIQQMLDAKIRFHITRKRKPIAVEKPSQAMDARKITLPNDSLQQLNTAGLLMIASLTMAATTGEIATTAQEVLDNDTVATQPVRGG